MNNKIPSGVRVLIVDLFAGMGVQSYGTRKGIPGAIIAYACEWNFNACKIHMANIFDEDGQPVMEPFIPITEAEYKGLRLNEDTKDTVGILDGQYVRTRWIQEVDGREIRAKLERKYGTNILMYVTAGPPCQLMSGLSEIGRRGQNPNLSGDEKNSPLLLFEYLRVLEQIAEGGDNVCSIMEEVPDFSEKQFEELHERFIAKAKSLPFNFSEQQLCSLHYGGRQMRWRNFIQFLHKNYGITEPQFPAGDKVSAKRVKDFLPHVEHFFSGHFVDAIKTKNHFMCTVTKGSPKWLEAKKQKWEPTYDELLQCFDLESGEWKIPQDVPKEQVKQAIANAVCINVSAAISKNLIENLLRLKHVGNGYYVPKDSGTDLQGMIENTSPNTPVPVTDTETDLLTPKLSDL